MNDYISRQAAIDAIESHIRVGDELYPLTHDDRVNNWGFEVSASCVYNLPSADVQPVQRGHWQEAKTRTYGIYECNVCKGWTYIPNEPRDYKFCPRCGARMDGEKE